MSDDRILDERRRGLEEAFFHRHNRELLERLRQRVEREDAIESLRAASGIEDEAVLGQLADLGLRGETFAALSLVPLIEVAWADGKIQVREREALARAAAESGILPGSDAASVLDAWLAEEPDDAIRRAWTEYVRALQAGDTGSAVVASLREVTLGRAEEIAVAAGGLLGLGQISRAEKRVLAELAEAFD